MRKVLVIFILSTLYLSCYTQKSHLPPEKLKFRNNWFVQGQLGMAYTLSEYYRDASFSDIIAPHFSIAIGKHTSPIMSARLQLEGWESKNYSLLSGNPQTYKIRYFQINIDRQFNLTTIIKRELSDYSPLYFTANIGLGYAHGFKNAKMQTKSTNMIVPRIGLSANWQLNNLMTLNFEMTANFYPDRFNGRVDGKKYDGVINTMVGIKYNLGEKNKQTKPSNEKALIQEDIDEIYNIMKEQDRPTKAQIVQSIESNPNNTLPNDAVVQPKILMNAIIAFDTDSAKPDRNQEDKIAIAAQYLQENPIVNLTIMGYSDNNDDSTKLTQDRTLYIREILNKDYGIDTNRITTQVITNPAKANTIVFSVIRSSNN